MFDKFKQMKKLSQLRDSIKEEKVEMEKEGIKATINGEMKVESIQLNEDLDRERQEKLLKDCVNEGIRKMQRKFAKKMKEMK